MASLLGAGNYGTIGGTLAAPITIYDSSVDGGACEVYAIANTDATNWVGVQVTGMHGGTSVFYILPGERILLKRGFNGNGCQKIVGFGCTPSNAGAANVLIVGGIQCQN